MTRERYVHLERTGEPLTEQEVANGWHYCDDWDGMLIHRFHPEMEGCTCANI